MFISTRGRYALRVMIDLAEREDGRYIPMKDVAERQGISLKYLERILPDLTKHGLLEGVHGKGGGYRLKCDPEVCTVWAVLTVTEGDLSPVSCLAEGAPQCARAAACRTLPLWKNYYALTKEYFSSITIADLTGGDRADEYVI
ncbi:MAG: Rrf2 family transcriptional regulator [Clostridia bacterium]|nr:Rrf2 family transcriptional regulator [Clostridia bacterium]